MSRSITDLIAAQRCCSLSASCSWNRLIPSKTRQPAHAPAVGLSFGPARTALNGIRNTRSGRDARPPQHTDKRWQARRLRVPSLCATLDRSSIELEAVSTCNS